MIFLGIGSSIGNAEEIFKSTEVFLKKHGVIILKKSKILKNPPIGGVAKNEFSNAVWQIIFEKSILFKFSQNENPLTKIILKKLKKTKKKYQKVLQKEALMLLKILQECEDFHDRKREKKWDDRSLDLDILMYHELDCETEKLTVPHSEIQNRDFVKIPWKEIVDENFEIPK